jgi:PIN domain nuclease of toxin-antitoxin system
VHVILIDTHILVRYAAGDRKLGKRALTTLEKALPARALNVSAISFWDISMLVGSGKLRLHTTVTAFRERTLAQGIQELVVDGELGVRSAELTWMHADPADRMIVATAVLSGATLVTSDAKILELKLAGFRCQDGGA